ncbi:MAG TPA: peptidylprolyl isomerase [Candidatus Saccharimonadales bacterium]|nr:peptidylprolyl isomerase [Candidatus Saccharimonadales bacterium]
MPSLASDSPKPAGAVKTPLANHRGWWVIGGTVVGLVALFLVVFAVLIYKYQSDSRIVQIVSEIVPYPAEQVNGHFASYSDYLFEVDSVKHYYLSQTTASGKPAVDFTTATGKQQLKQLQTEVLTELQQDSIVTQLSHKYKVSVSNKEVQSQVSQITKSAGGQAKLVDVLNKYYGWSISDLDKKVRFQLLEQKVSTAVQSDPALNAQAKSKAQGILNQVKAGGDFATLAKKYSQDSSASNGGDLGFFSKSQMVPAFSNAAFALQPGQVSGLVQSQYGYSIIKVIGYNSDHSQVDAAQILIKPIDFNTYLQQQVQQSKLHLYIHPHT